LAAAQSADVAPLTRGRQQGLPHAAHVGVAPRALRVATARPAGETHRQDARRDSPEAIAAEARIEQAEAAARATASRKWPDLRLVAGYTDYWSGDGRLTGEWQAGLRAGFPLLTGGGRRAAAERAGFELDAAAAGREATLRRLDTAVDRAAAAVASAGARAVALSAAVEQHREIVRIELLALDEGAGTRREWIVATADLASAQAALLEARHAQVRARLDLARLTGSLTLDSLDTLLEVVP
jgi:outer membrane protein TolC